MFYVITFGDIGSNLTIVQFTQNGNYILYPSIRSKEIEVLGFSKSQSIFLYWIAYNPKNV